MACRSLLLLTQVCASGACVVAEPPSYENPERTPPMIDLTLTFPVVTQIVRLRASDRDPQEFSVAVRSEDQGVKLTGLLYLDYSLLGEDLIGTGELPASTFDDTQRKLTISWQVPVELHGCHQVTMLVTHADNLSFIGSSVKPISQADVALAVWWVNVNPDQSNPDDLGVCPKFEAPL